ncbi:MAG: ester cyclase [Acidimicrobiia bacterium]
MNLAERRAQVVRDHMDSENRLAFDETLATFAHPHYELVATGTVYDGVDDVMGYYRSSRTAFPDQRNEIHSIRHADDAVIVEFDLLGTHSGPFLGIAPTGREFRCRMAAFFVFEDGTDRIEVERIYFDAGTILTQLGITF